MCFIRERRTRLFMKDSHATVQEFFDKDAGRYSNSRWEGSSVATYDYEITKQVLLNELALERDDRVLEIGCGPGTWTELIAPQVRSVTAVDIAAAMIGIAQKRVVSGHVTFWHGDFIQFDDQEAYDSVFCVRVLEYFSDKLQVIQRIATLLKPEGRLVLIAKSTPTLLTLRRNVIEKALPKTFESKNGPPGQRISANALDQIMRDTGFSQVRYYPVVIRLPWFARGQYWLPLLGSRIELLTLRFCNYLSSRIQSGPSALANLFLFVADTYIITGVKRH